MIELEFAILCITSVGFLLLGILFGRYLLKDIKDIKELLSVHKLTTENQINSEETFPQN